MRKLMWFTMGFAGACALGVYLLPWNWLGICCIAALVLSVGLLLCRRRACSVAAVLLLGFSIAMAWLLCYEGFYLSAARQYDGKTVDARIEITDYSYKTSRGVAADGKIDLNGKPFKVRLYLDTVESLSPGDVVEGKVLLQLTTRGADEGATYHQGNGIFLLAHDRGEVVAYHCDTVPGKYFAPVLRKNIERLIDRTFPADTLAFARALLLGDSSKITYEEDTAYKVSGIRHMIAVSGLHVSILFSMLYSLAGKKRFLTALIGIPSLLLFMAVAGFTPSVVRACIMQILVIIALMINREYDPPTALATAVLVMLVANPMTITSVSMQLSAGCMVGIFLFYGRIHDYILKGKRKELAKGKSLRAKAIRWSVNSVCITLSAMVVTTPLCAAYFGMVSVVGVLTNVLALWVVSFVFYGIMAAAAAGAIFLPAGKVIAWVVSWPMRYVQLIARILSKIPFAAVYTCSVYIVAWLIFCYLLLAVLLLQKKKCPFIFACCVIAGLIASVTASYLEPKLDNYRVTVLDVGQGQCILVQHENHYYMVDCGGDYPEGAADAAAQLLLSQGITKLNGIILTHYDTDHAGGIECLLTRIPADRLYLPDSWDENGVRKALTEKYADRIVFVNEDLRLRRSGLDISIFAPENADAGNESCLCILFQVEKCDILITGDRGAAAERQLLENTELPKLDLLVVGHHGSQSSTSFELLSQTQPAGAVISVGKDNYYGLPDREVLERLKLFGVRIWRTDKHGTIVFRG